MITPSPTRRDDDEMENMTARPRRMRRGALNVSKFALPTAQRLPSASSRLRKGSYSTGSVRKAGSSRADIRMPPLPAVVQTHAVSRADAVACCEQGVPSPWPEIVLQTSPEGLSKRAPPGTAMAVTGRNDDHLDC